MLKLFILNKFSTGVKVMKLCKNFERLVTVDSYIAITVLEWCYSDALQHHACNKDNKQTETYK